MRIKVTSAVEILEVFNQGGITFDTEALFCRRHGTEPAQKIKTVLCVSSCGPGLIGRALKWRIKFKIISPQTNTQV